MAEHVYGLLFNISAFDVEYNGFIYYEDVARMFEYEVLFFNGDLAIGYLDLSVMEQIINEFKELTGGILTEQNCLSLSLLFVVYAIYSYGLNNVGLAVGYKENGHVEGHAIVVFLAEDDNGVAIYGYDVVDGRVMRYDDFEGFIPFYVIWV